MFSSITLRIFVPFYTLIQARNYYGFPWKNYDENYVLLQVYKPLRHSIINTLQYFHKMTSIVTVTLSVSPAEDKEFEGF